MRIVLPTVVVSILACVTGCTTQPIALAPVGPQRSPALAAKGDPHGLLVVYSAFDATAGMSDELKHHSDYDLRSGHGQLIERVFNRANGLSEEPVALELAPGNYEVVARATRSRQVIVPIIIEADKTTCLRLDGSEPIGSRRVAASELVILPDVAPVGWRAKIDE